MDFSMAKSVKMHENLELQLRAETFNILNHANQYLNLSGSNDVNITPYISSLKDGRRQLQLAGKIVF